MKKCTHRPNLRIYIHEYILEPDTKDALITQTCADYKVETRAFHSERSVMKFQEEILICSIIAKEEEQFRT